MNYKEESTFVGYEKLGNNPFVMDIMVNNRGTSIIEIHPLFSCGIYQTILGSDFLRGYRDSLEYLKKYNTKLEPFECKW